MVRYSALAHMVTGVLWHRVAFLGGNGYIIRGVNLRDIVPLPLSNRAVRDQIESTRPRLQPGYSGAHLTTDINIK